MSSIPQQPSPDGDAPSNAPGEPVIDSPADVSAADAAERADDRSAEPTTVAVAEVASGEPEPEAPVDAPEAAPAEAPADVPPAAAAQAGPVADVSPAATAQQLKQLFPALFSGQPKPLKLRIQVDIQERAPGVFTKQALTAFFRRHTGSHGYLMAASRATHRYDLDGAPAGELSEEHRKIAVDELTRRRGNTEARRALEEEQRHNRATLLHDFERTTLTPANFCALKGISLEALDSYLGVARQEAAERMAQAPAFDQRERGAPPREQARDGRDRDRRGPPPGERQGPGPRQNAGPGGAPGGPARRRR